METFVPSTETIHGPIIPKFILDKKITAGAKIVYAILCDYASYYKSDHCYPSQKTLASQLSCSVSSVKNYLAELIGLKLISVKQRQNSSSEYYMMLPGELKGKESQSASQQPIIDYAQPKVGYINTQSKQRINTTPPLPPVPAPRSLPPASRPVGGGGFSSHGFEKIWEAYPKKEAKGNAFTAFQRLWKSGRLPSEGELLASIARFKGTENWQRENGRFIPPFAQFPSWSTLARSLVAGRGTGRSTTPDSGNGSACLQA
jgi:hypothetical protein